MKNTSIQAPTLDDNSTSVSTHQTAQSQHVLPEVDAVTYDMVVDASKTLNGVAHRTKIFTSETINEELTQMAAVHQQFERTEETPKIQVLFKCENLQKTGSFKFRGAYNAISKLTPEQKSKGVLAYSAGNHGQGVALSGKMFGIRTRIIIPFDAPKLKLDAMKGYGAELHYFDRYKEKIEEVIASQIAETGMTFVSPFDNANVIAGQGTIGKEIVEEVGHIDHLLMGIGGGGVVSGCAIATHQVLPDCKVYGVQPQNLIHAQKSVESGEIYNQFPLPGTIADGASTPAIGKINLPIMKKHLERIMNVDDDELIECMKFFGERCKMVVEPTGCLGLAAIKRLVKEGAIKPGDRVATVLTGGNIDMQRYTNLLMKDAIQKAVQEAQLKLREELSLRTLSTNDSSHSNPESPSSEGNSVLNISPECKSTQLCANCCSPVKSDRHSELACADVQSHLQVDEKLEPTSTKGSSTVNILKEPRILNSLGHDEETAIKEERGGVCGSTFSFAQLKKLFSF